MQRLTEKYMVAEQFYLRCANMTNKMMLIIQHPTRLIMETNIAGTISCITRNIPGQYPFFKYNIYIQIRRVMATSSIHYSKWKFEEKSIPEDKQTQQEFLLRDHLQYCRNSLSIMQIVSMVVGGGDGQPLRIPGPRLNIKTVFPGMGFPC